MFTDWKWPRKRLTNWTMAIINDFPYGDSMRIFVAGATGVIGRLLVPLLVAQGHEVDRPHPPRPLHRWRRTDRLRRHHPVGDGDQTDVRDAYDASRPHAARSPGRWRPTERRRKREQRVHPHAARSPGRWRLTDRRRKRERRIRPHAARSPGRWRRTDRRRRCLRRVRAARRGCGGPPGGGHPSTDRPDVRNFAANTRIRRVGTRNLVDAALAAGARRVISQSIAWAYEPGDTPAVESTPLEPVRPDPARRATVKAVAELESITAEAPEWVVLRYGMLYGPNTWYAKGGLMADLAMTGALSTGPDITSFLHTQDAAQAAASALHWPSGPSQHRRQRPRPRHPLDPSLRQVSRHTPAAPTPPSTPPPHPSPPLRSRPHPTRVHPHPFLPRPRPTRGGTRAVRSPT